MTAPVPEAAGLSAAEALSRLTLLLVLEAMKTLVPDRDPAPLRALPSSRT
ncbi:hypothetical protein [Sphingomonas sp. MMS24-J13]